MTPAQIVVAALAAGFLVLAAHRVRQRRLLRAALGISVAALLALYAAGLLTGVPDPRTAIEESGESLGSWAYVVVAAMAFLETSAPPVTLVFPGEWGVAYGGLLAREGTIDLLPLIALVWLASLVGDAWAFFLGRRLGRSYLTSNGEKFGVTGDRLASLDGFFARWGPATVALGRLVPIARPFVALVAGASDWPYRRFLPWNLVGTGVFAAAFTLLGYLAYATAERVVEAGSHPVFLAIAALLLAGGFLAALRRPNRPRRTE